MKVSDFAYLLCKCENARGVQCIHCLRLMEMDNSRNRKCILADVIEEHKGIYIDYIRAEYERAEDRRKEVIANEKR